MRAIATDKLTTDRGYIDVEAVTATTPAIADNLMAAVTVGGKTTYYATGDSLATALLTGSDKKYSIASIASLVQISSGTEMKLDDGTITTYTLNSPLVKTDTNKVYTGYVTDGSTSTAVALTYAAADGVKLTSIALGSAAANTTEWTENSIAETKKTWKPMTGDKEMVIDGSTVVFDGKTKNISTAKTAAAIDTVTTTDGTTYVVNATVGTGLGADFLTVTPSGGTASYFVNKENVARTQTVTALNDADGWNNASDAGVISEQKAPFVTGDVYAMWKAATATITLKTGTSVVTSVETTPVVYNVASLIAVSSDGKTLTMATTAAVGDALTRIVFVSTENTKTATLTKISSIAIGMTAADPKLLIADGFLPL